jgi:hypothetical protein
MTITAEQQTHDITPLMRTTKFFQVGFKALGDERTAIGTEQDIKTDADKAMLKVKKQLFGKSKEYRAIKSANARLMRQIDKYCVEGALERVRTVPNGNINRVFSMCIEHEVVLNGLVDKFVSIYPELYERVKVLLGPLFKADEYPAPEHVKAAFKFRYHIVSYDVPGDLRQLVDEKVYRQQLEQKQELMKNAADEINRTKCATMQAVLDAFKEELRIGEDGKSKKFKAKALKKLQKFVEDFDVMDVTNFEELKALKDQAAKLVSGITVDNIKSSEEFRANLLNQVSNIGELLKPLVEETGRALRVVI